MRTIRSGVANRDTARDRGTGGNIAIRDASVVWEERRTSVGILPGPRRTHQSW